MAASKQEVPSDLDTLRSSGHVQLPAITGTMVTVTLGYGGAASKYAVYVHEGTGPAVGRPQFMPPTRDPATGRLTPLGLWYVRHGIPEKDLFVRARALGRRGLAPRKYLERPFNEARAGMDARLAADVQAAMAKGGTRGAAR